LEELVQQNTPSVVSSDVRNVLSKNCWQPWCAHDQFVFALVKSAVQLIFCTLKKELDCSDDVGVASVVLEFVAELEHLEKRAYPGQVIHAKVVDHEVEKH